MLKRLPKGELLSFGCPDPLFEMRGLPDSPHAAEIRALHGFAGVAPDVRALFAANGWQITALDVHPTRAFERAADLNEPLPGDLIGKFDAVIDLGTGEHVFNIAQVFRSALAAVKVGGAVLHEHPCVMGNHGFWCTQPTAMLDFYSQNGCEVEAWICSAGRLSPANTKRFGAVQDKSTTVTVATKKKDAAPKWPTQSRYLCALAALLGAALTGEMILEAA